MENDATMHTGPFGSRCTGDEKTPVAHEHVLALLEEGGRTVSHGLGFELEGKALECVATNAIRFVRVAFQEPYVNEPWQRLAARREIPMALAGMFSKELDHAHAALRKVPEVRRLRRQNLVCDVVIAEMSTTRSVCRGCGPDRARLDPLCWDLKKPDDRSLHLSLVCDLLGRQDVFEVEKCNPPVPGEGKEDPHAPSGVRSLRERVALKKVFTRALSKAVDDDCLKAPLSRAGGRRTATHSRGLPLSTRADPQSQR